MNEQDKKLGLGTSIKRRDFVSGVSVALGASLLPGVGVAGEPSSEGPTAYYPPAQSGMRGSHPGSFEAAHATVQGQRWHAEAAAEHYDLVVVGAGISGLSAAHIYRRDINKNARVLVLDNHDDFGGHARRNEFSSGGRTFLCFGGTMQIEAYRSHPAVAKQVFRDLGLEPQRSAEFQHHDLFESLGVGACSFLDKDTFGADYLAKGSFGFSEAMKAAPLSAEGKTQLERLYQDKDDYLEGMSHEQRQEVLKTHSWREYLAQYGAFGEEVLTYIQKWPHAVWAIGADALPAWMAWEEGYPGFGDMAPGHSSADATSDEEQDEDFQFPDGNASIARLLVRKLVPEAAPGHSMEDVVMAPFDYSVLDREGAPTRIRLSSTVIDLRHRNADTAGEVDVTYVNGKTPHKVTASRVIWAGYHTMLPHICPDLPPWQKAAQAQSVRAPLVYTSVLIRNWQSFAKLGVRRAYCPGSFFPTVMLSPAVSIGGYRFPTSPDEPMVLHLQHIPLEPGLPAAQQFRAGRRALLTTPFETFERNVRDQLGRMLGPAGFDPQRDIEAITVNRWPHGYAYSVDATTGDVAWLPSRWPQHNQPWAQARQSVGNIAFAGTDASSNAMSESAIEEAHRAVHSLPGAPRA